MGGVGEQQTHEADHSPPCIAKVTNVWNYTSTHHTPSQCVV